MRPDEIFILPSSSSVVFKKEHCIFQPTTIKCTLITYFGEGNGTPLQYSCLENLWMGEPGRLQSMGSHWTRLSDFTFTFHFHALEKEMATHSRVLAWRIPGTGKPGGLRSMGSHRVGHDWRDLAAAAAMTYFMHANKRIHYNLVGIYLGQIMSWSQILKSQCYDVVYIKPKLKCLSGGSKVFHHHMAVFLSVVCSLPVQGSPWGAC